MFKTKCIFISLIMCFVAFASCSDDDNRSVEPTFSGITITPEKDVYRVGDVITCHITCLSQPSPDIKEQSYWWYASWWFPDPEMKADFQDFDESGVNTSAEITLTEAGEMKIYFFGKLDFPNFDWRKVEIARTVTVAE